MELKKKLGQYQIMTITYLENTQGIKAMNCAHHYNDEDLDKYYKMQRT